jgi:hypothetical protein
LGQDALRASLLVTPAPADRVNIAVTATTKLDGERDCCHPQLHQEPLPSRNTRAKSLSKKSQSCHGQIDDLGFSYISYKPK